MNNINIIGNLTADPIQSTDKDGVCCYFTVAVDAIGGKEADFFHCKAKGKQAENLCKYKKKGDKLGISGTMFSYKKEGHQVDGRPVIYWMLAAHGIDYCDNRRGEQQEPRQQEPRQQEPRQQQPAAEQGSGQAPANQQQGNGGRRASWRR